MNCHAVLRRLASTQLPSKGFDYFMMKRRFAARMSFSVGISILVQFLCPANAQLAIKSQFNANLGSLVGLAADEANDRIWAYSSFGTSIASFTRLGAAVNSVPTPGETSNDADVDITRVPFSLNNINVPSGSVLFFNGENGPAEVYAVHRTTGQVIATLQTAFGASHVVGGAYHAQRGALFLVADKLDAVNPSKIAEINPATGAVIRTFRVGGDDYIINYGDIAISSVTGNIFAVSSDETTIRELTPEGRDLPLPNGVSSLSGIGVNDLKYEAIVGSTGGTVFILSGIYTTPLLTIRYSGNSQVQVCWTARPDRTYILQRRSSLDASTDWLNHETNIQGAAPEVCRTENVSTGATMYYRVQELGAPIP